MTAHIHTELNDGVLTIRFQRPEKKNALTRAMYTAMTEAMRRADADPATRVLLFTGSGDCFTSGNDVADFVDTPPGAQDSPVVQFLRQIVVQEKPVVAAVNGTAIGVGVTMLLHCDLAYVAREAKLQMPFVNLGVCPEASSSLLLPAMAGRVRAAELLLLGERFTAETAREYGIVNAVLPDTEVLPHAFAKARQLAALPPNAVRTTKRLLTRASRAAVLETMVHEFENFAPMLHGPEALEAMTAFLQKRKPDFTKFS